MIIEADIIAVGIFLAGLAIGRNIPDVMELIIKLPENISLDIGKNNKLNIELPETIPLSVTLENDTKNIL
jgi:hypothetical protein